MIKSAQEQPLIFVAEDIPGNLQILANILRKGGYRISAAGNGRQALKMIPDVQPDLLLLDVMMPEMDGFEVCRRLKENPATRDIPVIFITARADTADIVKGFETGAVDYVTKPFNSTELLSRVKTHLELTFIRRSLREANAAKDRFFSIIAHDLKSPLQILLWVADALHNEYDDYSEDERKDYITKLYNGSNRLSSLLENLLDWSRSQMGVMRCSPVELDLNTVVKGVINLLEETAGEKHISLTAQIPAGITAAADKDMTRAVIRNLVSNAVKFTHPGGEVVITAEAKKDMAEITVADTGVGMDKETQDGIFRIDVRKTTRGTADEKGTGLGLILCKEFVEKNNGRISVASEPGKGSRFTFSLPREQF